MKINLGCGSQTPAGWINVDYAVGARFAKIPLWATLNRKLRLFGLDWNPGIVLHDLTTRFPWRDGTADVVYSSHTLEHMTRVQGRSFLGECYRVLRSGGVLRVVVPDLAAIVQAYVSGAVRSDAFVEELGVLYEGRSSRLKTRLAPFIQSPHRCMYDAPTLESIFEESGFHATARAPFASVIDDIHGIEMESRTEGAVIVEGTKFPS